MVFRASSGLAVEQEWEYRRAGFGSIQLETEGTLGSAALILMVYDVIVDGKPHRLGLEKSVAGWDCRSDGQPVHIDPVIARGDGLSLLLARHNFKIKRGQTASGLHS